MPSPLEQLTQKIIKAVPSIVTPGMWIAGKKWPRHERDIALEDVLIALGKYSQVGSDGKIIKINTWNGASYSYVCDWLLNTPLHLQSEETISEINKLIK